VQPGVQALLEAMDNNPPGKVRPCDVLKLINSLKLRKVCVNEDSKGMPQAPSKKATGLSDKGPKIPSKFTTD
jgi:hypothetical protein